MQPTASKLDRSEVFVDASALDEGCLVQVDEVTYEGLKAQGESLSEELANCVD